MFRLSEIALDPAELRRSLQDVRAGALATFEGRVRNHNDGKEVDALEYEAYGALAQKEGERILEEAKKKFEVYECFCVHRTGRLELGEIAVWVGVIAAHRDAALRACRYVIDEIKARVPIWKKEHYRDGHTDWVNCAGQHDHQHPAKLNGDVTVAGDEQYARQTILPEIGAVGQRKLRDAKVLIVGMGGLGCPAAIYLAAAGVGTIGICDSDTVEVSNLHRQVLFGAFDVGSSKADSAAVQLVQNYPTIKFLSINERLTQSNVNSAIEPYDVVLDCSDNFETKFLLSDACRGAKKTVIQASVYQFEGQLTACYADGSGQSLRELWGQTPEAGCVGTCTDSGVIGATVGVFGSLQALEAIKIICGIDSELRRHVVLFDLITLSTRKIRVKAKDNTSSAAQQPIDMSVPDWRIDALSMSSSELRQFELIDIRELSEDSSQLLAGLLRKEVVRIPLSTLDVDNPRLNRDKQYLFICQRGMRSDNLVAALRARGFNNAYSLAGGVEAVRRKFIA